MDLWGKRRLAVTNQGASQVVVERTVLEHLPPIDNCGLQLAMVHPRPYLSMKYMLTALLQTMFVATWPCGAKLNHQFSPLPF
jgi:hypothetical protein